MAKAKKQNKRNTKSFKKNRQSRQSSPSSPFQVTVNGSMGNASLKAKFADADRRGADCLIDMTSMGIPVTYYKENDEWIKQPNQYSL